MSNRPGVGWRRDGDPRDRALGGARRGHAGDVGEGIASVLGAPRQARRDLVRGRLPDQETFPRERISSLLQEFAAAGERVPVRADARAGRPLDAFADRLETLQGRRPAEDELMITSGAIEALELIGKSFLDPETWSSSRADVPGRDPGVPGFEATLVAVPLDEHGLEVDELERQLAAGCARSSSTIPDHQNPAGVSLAAERRRRWSSWRAATAS